MPIVHYLSRSEFYTYSTLVFPYDQNKFGWDYSGSSNLEELQLILEECIMIRYDNYRLNIRIMYYDQVGEL